MASDFSRASAYDVAHERVRENRAEGGDMQSTTGTFSNRSSMACSERFKAEVFSSMK
jgi:hypothetical protein